MCEMDDMDWVFWLSAREHVAIYSQQRMRNDRKKKVGGKGQRVCVGDLMSVFRNLGGPSTLKILEALGDGGASK